MKKTGKHHILFVIEDKQIPMDTRVLDEAKALKKTGQEVSILCPNLNKEKKYHKIIDNIHVFQYFCPFEGKTAIGIIVEYLIVIFFIFLHSVRIYLRKPFRIVHLANPPDFLILIFLPFKLFNVKIIFDHHDLSPELFFQKFQKKNFLYKLLLLLEKFSYKIADLIITTNKSIKLTCIKRNKVYEEKVIIVRNGPNLNEISFEKNKEFLETKNRYLIGYVGVIDKQDSLEKLVKSVDYMVNERNFCDFKVLIIGDGTDLISVRNNVIQKCLQDYFIFHGYENNRRKLFSLLSNTDICVEPRKESEYSSKSTAVKIMEYMALGKPIIQYNSTEGKISAGKASLYIENNDEKNFGEAIISLLKDSKRSKKMGEYGKKRVKEFLQWNIQKKELLRAYKLMFTKKTSI